MAETNILWYNPQTPHLINNKCNCSGPEALKCQRVGYQSKQKLLDYYQHSKNQLDSLINS